MSTRRQSPTIPEEASPVAPVTTDITATATAPTTISSSKRPKQQQREQHFEHFEFEQLIDLAFDHHCRSYYCWIVNRCSFQWSFYKHKYYYYYYYYHLGVCAIE
ncbi:hypothetical protein BGZ90_004914 [Linnemannia elongata]|nr:hypothetical protein BGZ90_004914 [Linnemannia elongata]